MEQQGGAAWPGLLRADTGATGRVQRPQPPAPE
jgi:hypothetical protein